MDITHYLEPEQVNAMLEHAKTCSVRDYIILRLLWRSGMRVSELLTLTPSDLEPYNQVLNITKAKGKKQRRVVVDPPMFAMLSTYIAETRTPEERPIFGLSSVHIWRLCQKYGKMIGVDVHPHMFRHSYAIHLIRNGVDLRRLQQLLGHSNIQTTTVYLQFRDQDLREVYNKVEF
jgi:integrase/recombinase XerD